MQPERGCLDPPETGRDRKGPPIPRPRDFRGSETRGHLDFGLPAFTLWGNKSLVCSDSLQQPWTSNPGSAGGKESTCRCMRRKRHKRHEFDP